MRPNPKFWRESASIIALTKNNVNKFQSDKLSNYKILMQRRSDKSGFLPGTIVFPGGTVENCDSSKDWFSYFGSFGLKNEKFNELHSKQTLLPPILQGDINPINRHISLRITAIRETFEELGVLICKQRGKESDGIYASYISDFDVKYWQKKVLKDPMEFLSLCQHLDCYPDIWSLFLWSNWLTPLGYESQRFDTLFFLTAFNSRPPVHVEMSEVTNVWWGSPEDVMDKFETRKIILPPPQYYELCRLIHQKDINNILKFSSERSHLGCDQIYPILLKPNKGRGSLAIFPGDELYPDKPDFENHNSINLGDYTIKELQTIATQTHRMEIYDLYSMKIHLKNYLPVQNQLCPSYE